MINYHTEIVKALNKVLPTYYEMILHSGLAIPCYSYMELNNSVESNGDTLGYSRITYQVKVWGTDINTLQHYALKADEVMRSLGFKRIAATELYDNNSAMMQKILTYEALALEEFN